MSRIFLLSPAHSGGQRARLLLRPEAAFELARRLRAGEAVTLGEVFAFLSGLYFRGKLAYAKAFAQPPAGVEGIWVITPSRGLVPAGTPVTVPELQSFAEVAIDLKEPRYTEPLRLSAENLSDVSGPPCEVVLLGSIATGKYVECLLPLWESRLLFPAEFVGRGDMSRGGLMLRCVTSGQELAYIPIAGAIRHGARPPSIQKR